MAPPETRQAPKAREPTVRPARRDILALMHETGAPCVISGVRVRKWRVLDHFRTFTRLQVGVVPYIADEPDAYRAEVGGVTVDVKTVLRLLAAGDIVTRRWKVRTRCTLADRAEVTVVADALRRPNPTPENSLEPALCPE